MPDLQREWGQPLEFVGHLTSVVQLGFIFGTLGFSLLALSDRFSPRRVFFTCAMIGALSTLSISYISPNFPALFASRAITGISLAGIYPVGMKIASGWYRRGLGNALGWVVGALVLGTAFPHLVRSVESQFPWRIVLALVSCLAATGGAVMFLLVPDGPYHLKVASLKLQVMYRLVKSKDLRSATFGYFGHMWELYTFYAYVPLLLSRYVTAHRDVRLETSFWTFCIISSGALGCVLGGYASDHFGSPKIAWFQLLLSGMICLCSPLLFMLPKNLFLVAMITWGVVVVGDSPQFSTVIAHFSPTTLVGSTLTMSTCIGFTITIISIQLVSALSEILPAQSLFVILSLGPLVGLVSFFPLAFE